MSLSLLREYVSLVMEKIRTKKDHKGGKSDKFDLKKFKSIEDRTDAAIYADDFLQRMGQGSSRVAFLLSSKYVLKVALNDAGVAQNETEVSIFTNPASKAVMAHVYDSSDDYTWIIADLVKPLQSVEEFEQLAGVDWLTFCKTVLSAVKGVRSGDSKKDISSAPPFAKAVIATARQNKMLRGDLAQSDFRHPAKDDVLDHYGKTPDGRIVLLDYGLTGEVWNAHYAPLRGETYDDDDAPKEKTKAQGAKNNKQRVGDPNVNSRAQTQPRSGVSKTQTKPQEKTSPETPDKKKAAGADVDRDQRTRR